MRRIERIMGMKAVWLVGRDQGGGRKWLEREITASQVPDKSGLVEGVQLPRGRVPSCRSGSLYIWSEI